MGYLLCGPIGTGKTFLVECLAGEAGVPVVKLKNFRDKWVGSSEGNLEKILRLIRALGRCIVFVDEADQTLGRRESGPGDSGLSGRLYSMIAQEMSDTSNRGKVVWVLASSRPDLIEVDLKRPGRIDLKVPILPTTTRAESRGLIAALARRYELPMSSDRARCRSSPQLPLMLTPGAAEALVVKAYRVARTENIAAGEALARALQDYQNPIPEDVLEKQMKLAVREATDLSFVPEACATSLSLRRQTQANPTRRQLGATAPGPQTNAVQHDVPLRIPPRIHAEVSCAAKSGTPRHRRCGTARRSAPRAAARRRTRSGCWCSDPLRPGHFPTAPP